MKLIDSGPCFHLRFLTTIVLCCIVQSFAASAAFPANERTKFDHLEESTLFFNVSSSTHLQAGEKPLRKVKTSLNNLSFLGELKPDEGEPYFIFSGRSCQNCLEDRSIYVIRPSNPKPMSFVYPGKIFEPKSRALLLESRTFWGDCLPNMGSVIVVFQKEKVDRRSRMLPSVLVAKASKNFLEERLFERHLPSLTTTLRKVKQKVCHEIEGRNRLMLSKPLDLHPHSNLSNDDEDDEGENVNTDSL